MIWELNSTQQRLKSQLKFLLNLHYILLTGITIKLKLTILHHMRKTYQRMSFIHLTMIYQNLIQTSIALVSYTDIFLKSHIWKFGLKSVDLKYNSYKRNTGLNANIVSAGFKFLMD